MDNKVPNTTSVNSRLADRLSEIKGQNNTTPEVAAPRKESLLSEVDIPGVTSPNVEEKENTGDVNTIEETRRSDLHIKLETPEDTGYTNSVAGDELFDAVDALKAEIPDMAKDLAEKQEEYLRENEPKNTNNDEKLNNSNISGITTVEDEIADAIAHIDEMASEGNVPEEEDIEEILKKHEESKIFVDIPENEYDSGPAGYIVETDERFLSEIDTTLDRNGIKYVKVSDKDRMAVLNQFTSSGSRVSVALPNSGFFVEFTGAGVDDLMAFASIDEGNPMNTEIAKLAHLCKYITNSSIGPIKLQQLIKIVSYYDLNTLYYGLFAATHPDKIEYSRACPHCGVSYQMNIRTRDLLINYKDFEQAQDDIRNNVTTYTRLIASSKLGKIHSKVLSNGMIVYYKHPSLETYLVTYQKMRSDIIKRYDDVTLNIVFCVDKIALPDTRKGAIPNSFIEITDPNEITQIIGSIRNADEKYELAEMVDEVIEAYVPLYGYHEVNCPNCGGQCKEEEIGIDSLLFTLAREENSIAYLKHLSREQKKQKMKSQLKK